MGGADLCDPINPKNEGAAELIQHYIPLTVSLHSGAPATRYAHSTAPLAPYPRLTRTARYLKVLLCSGNRGLSAKSVL